jgi:hypothetical protein
MMTLRKALRNVNVRHVEALKKARITNQDTEVRMRKAKGFDQALAYLRGRAQNEEGCNVLRILERALEPEGEDDSK